MSDARPDLVNPSYSSSSLWAHNLFFRFVCTERTNQKPKQHIEISGPRLVFEVFWGLWAFVLQTMKLETGKG